MLSGKLTSDSCVRRPDPSLQRTAFGVHSIQSLNGWFWPKPDAQLTRPFSPVRYKLTASASLTGECDAHPPRSPHGAVPR
jgi:hypothetical protein